MSGYRFGNGSRGVGLRARSALVVAALLALVLAQCMAPVRALAVVNLGTVTVSAPGSVSLASGDTVSVSAACNPAYSDQLPCCLNDYCPSGCDFDKEYGAAGVGCEDASGQCTCFGYSYSRYYPTCTVSSSDPSVARATWADGVLVVSGYKPGTATVTIYPSMRLWTGAPASVTVNVSEGAGSGSGPANGEAGGSSTSSGGAAVSTGGGAAAVVQRDEPAGGNSGASASGGATNQMTGQATNNVETVVRSIEVASESGDSAVVETESGDIVAHLDDGSVDVAALLSEAAGSDKLLSLWGGKSPETPDYIWTIGGLKLPADYDYAGIDLSLDDVTYSNSALRSALGDQPYSAFKLAGSGKLPCTMQLMWRSVGTIDNGQVVDVYLFDEATGAFKKVHSNLTTGEGYVTFNLIESGTYVVTADSGLDGGEAPAEAIDDGKNAAAAAPGGAPDWAAPAATACVAVVAAAAAFAIASRKKRDSRE